MVLSLYENINILGEGCALKPNVMDQYLMAAAEAAAVVPEKEPTPTAYI